VLHRPLNERELRRLRVQGIKNENGLELNKLLRILAICFLLSDFSTGEVFITVVLVIIVVLVFGGSSGSNCVIHVKFLMSRI